MATQFPFGVGQNDSHGAELIRRMIGIEYSSIGGVGGKASDNHLQVVQHGAGAMSVDVYAGECVIPGSLATWQGKYYGLNDATISGLAISASNPSNPRWDAVYIAAVDTAYAGASDSLTIAVATGTPSGSPAFPTLPANAYLLAYIYVGAAVTQILTANITDKRNLLASNGPLSLNPGARMHCASTGAPSSGAALASSWTSDYTAGGCTVGATTGITVPVPGRYHIDYHVALTVASAGYMYPSLFVNGSAVSAGNQSYSAGAGTLYATGSDTLILPASATISEALNFSTGGNLVNDAILGCWIAATLMGQ